IGVYHPDVLVAVGVWGIAAVQGTRRYKGDLTAARRPNGNSIKEVCDAPGKPGQRGWTGAIGVHHPDVLGAVGVEDIAPVQTALRYKGNFAAVWGPGRTTAVCQKGVQGGQWSLTGAIPVHHPDVLGEVGGVGNDAVRRAVRHKRNLAAVRRP